jgi:hypothetical protein
MSCCPLLAWRSPLGVAPKASGPGYSAGASPRCTLNSYRPEGKARPGLLGGEHLRPGYASSARPSARDPTHERRVAGGHRRQSRRSPPALPLDQRDGPSASRTRTQAGKHWGTPSCAPPRSGSPSRLPAGSAGQARRRAGAGSDTVQLLWAAAASRPAARRRRAAASLQRWVVCASPWCGEAGHGAGHGGCLLV